jgi:predicted kinase
MASEAYCSCRGAAVTAPRLISSASGVCQDRQVPPVLVAIGGQPATGKSTVARSLAESTRTPYLRVDLIEQAMVAWSSLAHPVGAVGYAVAYVLAAEQLSLGLDVVVECVNPLALTRDSWVATAEAANSSIVEVEMVCSDAAEHRLRVETRASDVEGLIKPTWRNISEREYEKWSRPHLVVDSTTMSVSASVSRIVSEIASVRGQPSNPRL